MMSDFSATATILVAGLAGLLASVYYAWDLSKIRMEPSIGESHNLIIADDDLIGAGEEGNATGSSYADIYARVLNISRAISEGANSFLFQEYKYMMVRVVIPGVGRQRRRVMVAWLTLSHSLSLFFFFFFFFFFF
jgi:hypothetical protein